MRYLLLTAGGLLLVILILAGFRAWLLFPQVALQPIAATTPLEFPTHMAELPDGTGDMAVTEKAGVVKRIDPAGHRGSQVLLDISDRVVIEGWEDGLFSIAFHPQFERNGQLYVMYTAAEPRRLVISRFTMNPVQRRADASNEQVILEIAKPGPNHNGGMLVFALDGTLMISVGDSQIPGFGQRLDSLLGKILRIDVNRPSSGRAYSIPPDNPFIGMGGSIRPEIWAYGLRNPWRFSIDPSTGEMYADDVGEITYEEINRIEKGGNYGWAIMEGDRCHENVPDCDPSGFIAPIASFPRFVARAVIGGFVYRGAQLPWLNGQYVFGTYFRGLYSIPLDESDVISVPEVLLYRPRSTLEPNVGKEIRISSLAEDMSGELYVIDLKGGVYKIVEK